MSNPPPPAPQSIPLWAKLLIGLVAVTSAALLLFAAIEFIWIHNRLNDFFTAGESDDATTGPPPDVAADFSKQTCEDFDLTTFDAFAGGSGELASSSAYPDEDTKALYCHFETPAGQKLDIGIAAGSDEGYAADALVPRRERFEEDPAWTVADLSMGSMTGFSSVYPGDAWETYGAEVGYERVMISVSVVYAPGAGRRETAAAIADAAASRALDRFMDYA
ncbi:MULTISPECIES: hypothetical protein [Glycomyces]|uniref:DUF3558 domain-containing protein n=1 Tax=Glycomyces lechevalierae TaxID=256034 RepID=A0A9X3PQT8_9ACTN|nr:hypothetical protein [Glycomyces lechevalierae]MDA1383768.1 hypothetical protein [Glycomyces lechevalierae]MDR7341239.1 hypothetical protein [Glycomyces lechevalierae]